MINTFTTKHKRIIISVFVFYIPAVTVLTLNNWPSRNDEIQLLAWALLICGYWVAIFLINWIRKAD